MSEVRAGQRRQPSSRSAQPAPGYVDQPTFSRSTTLSPVGALLLPLSFTAGLAAFMLLPGVRQNPNLFWSFAGAAAALLVWIAILFRPLSRRGRTLTLAVVLRKQHYLQACAQGSVLVYWGLYWDPVGDYAYLIAAQLVFAFAFDALLGWTRRDTYTLGFGPFPVIFSINLFLWFRPDWFYLQFLLVALGFAAKDFIRWTKEGRPAHIFNPSSFPLAVFSLALMLTGRGDITWGEEIATTQFFPPHMYLMLFLIGLPGQYFFGVTTMTMSAVVTTYLFGLAYFAATGVYFFFESYIPIAVFLGMHLLFTDPSTSPRTELGRIIFGALYGLSTIFLFWLLTGLGMPTFYDKLLQVPVLNLSIQLIDRMARSRALRGFDPAALGRSLAPRRRHLAYMTVWAVVFAGMSAVQGVGDAHPGQFVPFWQQACAESRPGACSYLQNMQQTYCVRGSGWACNEFGMLIAGRESDLRGAAEAFQRSCDVGFNRGCANNALLQAGTTNFESAPPLVDDLPIVLRGTKGPIADRTPSALYARACQQGWPGACEQRAEAPAPSGDLSRGLLEQMGTPAAGAAGSTADVPTNERLEAAYADVERLKRDVDSLQAEAAANAQPGSPNTATHVEAVKAQLARLDKELLSLQSDLARAREVRPNEPTVQWLTGELLMMVGGEPRDVLPYLTRAVEGGVKRPEAFVSLARVQLDANQFGPAYQSALRALEMDRESQGAWEAFEGAALATDRVDEVLARLDRAFPSEKPRWAAALRLRAETLRKDWTAEQALRQADRAAGGLPRVRLTIEHRAFEEGPDGHARSTAVATGRGDVELELFRRQAPATVANFIKLVESGFYDGTRFHWAEAGSMVVAGDPNTRNDDPADDGSGGPGYAIPDEFHLPEARLHFRGSVSMVQSAPGTAGSQFFIELVPHPAMNRRLTVFARVVSGQETVDRITPGRTNLRFGRFGKIIPGDLLVRAEVIRR